MIEINVDDIFIRIDKHEQHPVDAVLEPVFEPAFEPEPMPVKTAGNSKTIWSCIVGSISFTLDIIIQQASQIYQSFEQFSSLKYFQWALIILTIGSFVIITIERFKKLKDGV